ncbi:MAG: sn-glycerol-1-phosphate dehydrogenase [Anaerolineae bacterium]|nr:sn-glycerol-1-phosphate dehydrogenase [Anaerolineae bacterium]
MTTNLSIYIQIKDNILPNLVQYCLEHQLTQFILVADQNTYPVLGQAVEKTLKDQGWDVVPVILTGAEIVPDERYLIQVLVQADTQDRTYLAVGSGVITDITRFASHRTKASFISIPTAPSVDGFTSIGAPLVIGGLKQTVICQPPAAVFAHLPTLCAAPKEMIASGFGDMLGKYTSAADWALGHLLWDEPYDDDIARRARQAVQGCTAHAAEIGAASAEGIRFLVDGLIESGLCMLDFGGSSPASGMEHHISHHLEMKIVWDKLPAVLHGAKVGVATLIAASYFERIRQLSQAQAKEKLAAVRLPSRDEEIARIKAVYAPIAERVVAAQAPFLNMSAQDYELLKQKIVDRWPQIQEIAATVPPAPQMTTWLHQVGAATDMPALGLSNEETEKAVKNSHYLRNRFTVAKLSRMLGLL